MKNAFGVPQLLLRLSLGVGFLLPVMDRFGWLGPAGVRGNAWGNWENFTHYTHSLVPFLNDSMANISAVIATAAEILLGVALIVGYKTRLAAMGSFVLTLIFAISMFVFLTPRAPFNYAVFVVSFASLLLAVIPNYRWAITQK